MTQPLPFARDFDFAPLAVPASTDAGLQLNAELDAISGHIDQIRNSFARIQRDDGALGNGSVHPDSLSARTRALITGNWMLRGAWTTGIAYSVRDTVTTGGIGYVCLVAHTAGVFATDLAAEKWLPFYSENLTPGLGSVTIGMLSPGFLLPLAMLATFTAPGAGAVARAVTSVLGDVVDSRMFGSVGDGVADDTTALNNAATRAAAIGAFLHIPGGTYKTTAPVYLPGGAAGLDMHGVISYAGAGSQTALTIGDSGATPNRAKMYRGIRVIRATQADWTTETDTGIALYNIDACEVEIRQAEGFTIGVRLIGDTRGCEDSVIHLGRIVNNRFGLDLYTNSAAAWMNSLAFVGGHFACGSTINTGIGRYGVRLSRNVAAGAYTLHNALRFYAPAFELQRQGTPGTVDAIPFLVEVDGRGLLASGVRMEACSEFVARHTSAMNDCVYETAYVGTYGSTGCAVDYTGATRAGGTSLPLHQAAAALHTPRLIAAAENVRSRAFRQTIATAGGIGFDEMVVLSGNPAGPPTTLTGFGFSGLDLITLNNDHIELPTSRGIGFCINTELAKEIVLAVDGDYMRPIVMQFDGSENVLDSSSPVLFSNMNTIWAGSPSYFHEGNVNLDALSGAYALNYHQRITLHANARFAIIGVRGGDGTASNNKLRSLRLFAPGTQVAPRIVGADRAWGRREYTVAVATGTVTIAAAGTQTWDINLPGVRQGDMVSVGYARGTGFQNGGVIFHASVGGTASTNQVRVTAQNISGGAIAIGDGDMYVRAVKPRL